jgi:hypothetical protein
MLRSVLLTAVALVGLNAAPAMAQRVIENPGWCAQFYPNANCQNYGAGNPYTSYGYATNDGWSRRPYPYHRRYYRHYR